MHRQGFWKGNNSYERKSEVKKENVEKCRKALFLYAIFGKKLFRFREFRCSLLGAFFCVYICAYIYVKKVVDFPKKNAKKLDLWVKVVYSGDIKHERRKSLCLWELITTQ